MNHIPQAPRNSVLDEIRRQRQPAADKLTKRSLRVTLLKRALPAAALLLLVALALAPSWHSSANRVTYHVTAGASTQASRMQGATYHGRDQQGQPYTVTASSAVQQGDDNVALVAPQGDITLKSGSWLSLKSANGDYHQKSDRLELDGGVTLYRNDGTVVTTQRSAIDLHAGDATSTDPVQVTGPFGTLNAQKGFTLTGRGSKITFNGPATLTLTQVQ